MKKLHIKGDPGQNNAYTEVNIGDGSFNPAAQQVINNYFIGDKEIARKLLIYEKVKREIHDEWKDEVENMHLLSKMMPGAKVASFLAFLCRIFGYHFFFISF